MNGSYTIEDIRKLLDSSSTAVERAVLAIWKRQTADEKVSQDTRWKNGVGFSGAHASLGTYWANWINSGKHLDGKHLECARTIMKKYAGQLCDIANTHQGDYHEGSLFDSVDGEFAR